MTSDFSKDDETRPASIEDFNSITPERWAELDAMTAEYSAWREKMNIVPYNKDAERYILDRYPLRMLYERADLQDIAESHFDTLLTEEEIQSVGDEFISNYPDEIHLAIADAIERVIDEREQKNA
jgi:hypothetical protein